MGSDVAANVTIYTRKWCGYCSAAKRLLTSKRVAFDEIAADNRPDLRAWLVEASSQHTVPQIFINGVSVGGYSELAELEEAQQLDAMLQQPPGNSAKELPR